MANYLVTWEIDIEADSPRDAARQALATQRDVESSAVVFDCADESGERTRVDLETDESEDYVL